MQNFDISTLINEKWRDITFEEIFHGRIEHWHSSSSIWAKQVSPEGDDEPSTKDPFFIWSCVDEEIVAP